MMTSAMRTLLYTVLLCGGALAPAETPAPASAEPIEQLGRLLGRWTTRGEMKATPYSTAGAVSSELDCGWAPRHSFMICSQLVRSAAGAQEQLSVYTYSAAGRAFRFVGWSREDAHPRTPELRIEDNVWSYSSETEIDGRPVRFRTVNTFTSPTTMLWRSEYAEGSAPWRLLGEGADERVE